MHVVSACKLQQIFLEFWAPFADPVLLAVVSKHIPMTSGMTSQRVALACDCPVPTILLTMPRILSTKLSVTPIAIWSVFGLGSSLLVAPLIGFLSLWVTKGGLSVAMKLFTDTGFNRWSMTWALSVKILTMTEYLCSDPPHCFSSCSDQNCEFVIWQIYNI